MLFAHQISYKGFHVFSDRPVTPHISGVLDDAIARLEHCELYTESAEFNLYLSHNNWLFTFFTRNPNAGGQVNFLVSPNIFIRACNLESNELIPPNGWMFEMETRPLSYFIAHEAVHVLQRRLDPLMIIKSPVHVVEGYADYIAKRPDFDFMDYRTLLLEEDPSMNPKHGLYKRYHLYNAFLIDSLEMSFKQILDTQPELESTLDRVRN